MHLSLYIRIYVGFNVCNASGIQLCLTIYFYLLPSAKMAEIRSRGLLQSLLIASKRLMNQPVEHPVQDLVLFQLWIVLFGLINFLWEGLLPQQNSYGSLWICVVWSVIPFRDIH